MKRTLTEQYGLIKKGKGHKDVFLKEAKKLYPNLLRQGAAFNEVSKILKQKNIINENFVGMSPINNPFEVKEKEGYENAFESFLQEAAEVKAEEKKVSKEVEEDQSRGYDTADKKDPNNMIFGQIQMGYYCELKNPKNADKTEQEIKDIVFKNLEKDPIFYTKNGQFGEEGVGYTDDNVSLGIPEEPKGEHKSSGYGKLKEHSISTVGGIVTGTGFVGMDYREYYGLDEAEDDKDDTEKIKKDLEDIKKSSEEISKVEMFQEDDITPDSDAPEHMEAVADAVEMAYEAGMSTSEIIEFVEMHLGLKMGDY
jgi:hypothetical protein